MNKKLHSEIKSLQAEVKHENACYLVMNKKCRKLEIQVKNLENWNKEMYENHKVEVGKLQEKCKEYEYIGKRVAAQGGNWLMLHAGAMEWLIFEFERLKGEK